VILDALLGRTPFAGTLPFDLPRSMAAVQASREDVPFDTVDPLYPHGHGLRLAEAEKLAVAR
jgi:beta-glucosidase